MISWLMLRKLAKVSILILIFFLVSLSGWTILNSFTFPFCGFGIGWSKYLNSSFWSFHWSLKIWIDKLCRTRFFYAPFFLSQKTYFCYCGCTCMCERIPYARAWLTGLSCSSRLVWHGFGIWSLAVYPVNPPPPSWGLFCCCRRQGLLYPSRV